MDSAPLIAQLQSGPRSASELTQALGISQPTLSRRIASASEAVVAFGAARRTSYALRRRVGGHDRFAIYRVRASGAVEPVGELIPVHPSGYVVRTKEANQYLQGLPWWLHDMRPQGFLGRSFVHAHATALNLPPEIELWNDDHCLIALAERGEDFIGNLIVGEGSLSRFLAQSNATLLPASQRAERYPQFARAALAGELIGSSAGGDQPKFSTLVQHADGPRAVLVKFSAPGNNEITARWRSLLIAEHIAHETLNAVGLRAAQSELLFVDGQCFLEIRRFDRIGSRGRRGVVSLGALDNAFVGRAAAPWPIASAALARTRQITPQADASVQRLHAFGRLIGNSDM
ncbi:MAG TPA: type II toxin-antitoxin system HipA family toxin YjjJ, partial [Burkholderiales bacterium]|nr:type II toxin-antitoxin system HipA family toxin YjjJ [Burkholderiales bacterium]